MARIEIDDRLLIVHIEGLDKLLAWQSRITVPLSHVKGASLNPEIPLLEAGDLFVGNYAVNHHAIGTRHPASHKGRVFCDVRDPSKAIAIDLNHEKFARVVIELSDESPESAVERITKAL